MTPRVGSRLAVSRRGKRHLVAGSIQDPGPTRVRSLQAGDPRCVRGRARREQGTRPRRLSPLLGGHPCGDRWLGRGRRRLRRREGLRTSPACRWTAARTAAGAVSSRRCRRVGAPDGGRSRAVRGRRASGPARRVAVAVPVRVVGARLLRQHARPGHLEPAARLGREPRRARDAVRGRQRDAAVRARAAGRYLGGARRPLLSEQCPRRLSGGGLGLLRAAWQLRGVVSERLRSRRHAGHVPHHHPRRGARVPPAVSARKARERQPARRPVRGRRFQLRHPRVSLLRSPLPAPRRRGLVRGGLRARLSEATRRARAVGWVRRSRGCCWGSVSPSPSRSCRWARRSQATASYRRGAVAPPCSSPAACWGCFRC